MKQYLEIGLVGIIVILLGAFFFLSKEASDLAYYQVPLESGSIVVGELPEDGRGVPLTVAIPKNGFVTIHESLSGAPAEIIGTSALIIAGESETTIPLTTTMIPGTSYLALLHVDNGDGVFVVNDDLPVKVAEEVVMEKFVFVPEAVTIPEPAE